MIYSAAGVPFSMRMAAGSVFMHHFMIQIDGQMPLNDVSVVIINKIP